MFSTAYIPPALGVFGLFCAWYIFRVVKRHPQAEGRVREIGEQIHLGAMVFMRREYRILAIFSAVVLVLLWIFLGGKTALAFAIGALASGLAGWYGMYTWTSGCYA